MAGGTFEVQQAAVSDRDDATATINREPSTCIVGQAVGDRATGRVSATGGDANRCAVDGVRGNQILRLYIYAWYNSVSNSGTGLVSGFDD